MSVPSLDGLLDTAQVSATLTWITGQTPSDAIKREDIRNNDAALRALAVWALDRLVAEYINPLNCDGTYKHADDPDYQHAQAALAKVKGE